MKHYTKGAPYGVTVIQLENGDEALYLNGQNLASADFIERDDPVTGTGERLAETLGVPFRLLTLPVPENEEWAWNDIVAALGWGTSVTLSSMMVRPVMECCIAHIEEEDNLVLADLSRETQSGEWIIDTGVGYLIRLDAVMYPILKLKKYGLSKSTRRLIVQCRKQINISMIHFSSVGDELDGFPVFDW